MRANEQSVIVEQEKSQKLKEEFNAKFIEFNNSDQCIEKFQGLYNSAVNYFNSTENFVANSDLLGAHYNDNWVVNLAETCLSILESISIFYEFLDKKSKSDSEFNDIIQLYRVSPTAYSSMQKIVKHYLPDYVPAIKSKFEEYNLPVHGFQSSGYSPRQKINVDKLLAVGLGVVFLLIILVIVIFIPEPTEQQFFVFRVILSLAAGAFGAVIPGFFEIDGKIKNISFRTTGAVSFFLITYMANPPEIIVS